jgi:ABC-2 type transport system ATP-binding protein
MNALTVKNVTKTFQDGETVVTALNDVTLHIKKGEIYGLLGPNGAGKTTLINSIAGLVIVDSGEVRVFQYGIKKQLQKIQQIINVVPGFSRCYSSLTINEFLRMYSYLYAVPNWRKRREEVLDLLELQPRKDQPLMSLSSGYKQRVLLAKALLTKPKLLLMDEPTIGLDVEIAIKMRGLMKKLKSEGHTILLTTHNMFDVEELCDRIALISKGRVVVEGTIDDVKKRIVERNAIEIECQQPRKVAALFKTEKYVLDVKVLGAGFIVYVAEHKYIKTIMLRLGKIKEKIFAVKILEPTLEEAFIKLTSDNGRTNKKKEGEK